MTKNEKITLSKGDGGCSHRTVKSALKSGALLTFFFFVVLHLPQWRASRASSAAASAAGKCRECRRRGACLNNNKKEGKLVESLNFVK